jgi:hypothetical protein
MKAGLAAELSAETDERRARLLRENYRLFFEDHGKGRAADEYWDPGQPPGPQARQG